MKESTHLNHIKNYGPNWGITHIKEQIQFRQSQIRQRKKEIAQAKRYIKAYQIALRKAIKIRYDKKHE